MESPPIINAPAKKPGSKLIVRILAVLVGVFGVLAFLIYLGMPRPPKEGKLIQNFYTNHSSFEELRNMLQADKNLRRVADWGVEINKPFFLGYPSTNVFPIDRFAKYLVLLKQTGGLVASRQDGENADPSILLWGWGWAGTTRHIGICWMEQAPTNQITTLDGFHNQIQYPRQVVFRHVDTKWYLWTDL
ncbi:MAG TPA: hypothetical protein VGO67_10890 [Verrucomicrobiae bacterium]|jgi:hypothetical protein